MIEVNHLTRYYGDFAALRDVSFSVREGEIIGLLGLNGAGKSTTLKVLAGLLPPSEGTVTVDGTDVASAADAFRARIGYLPEDPPLYRDMTVAGFLRFVAKLRGLPSADVENRVREVVAITSLQGREDQVIGTLSHGYRKRVGIAQAVIHNPRLVILDEPISGLDPRQILEMRTVIRDLGKGRAVLVSSHILSEISQTCDRIFVLHEGRLVAIGTEDELTARTAAGSKVHISIRGDQAAFEAWLRANPRVSSVAARPVHGLASATVTLVDDNRESLLAELIAAGFAVRRVEEPDDELESIFLGLTRDTSGGQA